eukprot:TRINITY_DN17155_c0_g1_i2.p2 TRINITY_DN17155_c0_g1~~TRINITY_DN17155_c0_g1_i2.p2  ORF type:complete len:166 (-),score=3.21 TRINITY_DN17155_c0_g1_i2:505-1002(-)
MLLQNREIILYCVIILSVFFSTLLYFSGLASWIVFISLFGIVYWGIIHLITSPSQQNNTLNTDSISNSQKQECNSGQQWQQQQIEYTSNKSYSQSKINSDKNNGKNYQQQQQISNFSNKDDVVGAVADHSGRNGDYQLPCNCIAHQLTDLFARHEQKFAKYKKKI